MKSGTISRVPPPPRYNILCKCSRWRHPPSVVDSILREVTMRRSMSDSILINASSRPSRKRSSTTCRTSSGMNDPAPGSHDQTLCAIASRRPGRRSERRSKKKTAPEVREPPREWLRSAKADPLCTAMILAADFNNNFVLWVPSPYGDG